MYNHQLDNFSTHVLNLNKINTFTLKQVLKLQVSF